MTRSEVSTKYNIPADILVKYEEWNLRNADNSDPNEWYYDDKDIEHISLIMTLYNIGFSDEEVGKYMRLYEKNDKSGRLYMLNNKRHDLLEEIHDKENKLEDVDYLRFELKSDK